MDRPTRARFVLLLALALGIAFEVLFYGSLLGVNLVLFELSFLVTAALVRPRQARFDRLDWWLPFGALVLAAFVALRTDPGVVAFDALASVAALGLAIPALTGIAVTRRSVEGALLLATFVASSVAGGAVKVLRRARGGLQLDAVRAAGSGSIPILRGLLLALPIVFVFTALFAAADAVFEQWVGTLLGAQLELGDLPDRMLVVLGGAWLAAGALWFVAGEPPPLASPAPASLGAAAAGPLASNLSHRTGSLGSAETLVVLVAVDLLFGVFVVLQVAYLFGGLDTLAAAGTTYAEYARRGFFELLYAGALAIGLIGGLEAVVARRTRGQAIAALVLVGLTAVILASALLRLGLYQQAYGWTTLRFWALAGIVAVGLGLGATALLVLRGRTDRLPHALTGATLAVTVAVNIVGPAGFVADRNLERARDPWLIPADGERMIDAEHLAQLGDDAVPALVAALPWLPRAERATILRALRARHRVLETDPALAGWPAWNLARHRAREALANLPLE